MFLFAFILALTHVTLAQVTQNNGIQVNTTEGVVQGAKSTDGNYYTFYGLYYGGNTAGDNRFKAPTPPAPYPGVYMAHDSSILCAQPTHGGIVGNENCLTVNVFTNATSPAKPVLVWLQGEEYTTTYSKIDQQGKNFRTLVSEGLVVVQMNYRLSIFGFLCLGVPEAPGNAGLKDIVQGLKWIKQNIAAFGGDPNNVILFGHGSAAAMVDLITLSPLGKGLAHKAIALSGSALAPWAVSYNPIQYAHAFSAKLDYSGKSNQDLAKHLVVTDLTLLGNALREFEFYNNSILFAPCIENPKLNVNDTFLHDAPINILKSGNYSDIPYIAGYADKEGTMRAEHAAVSQPGWLQAMNDNFTNFLQVDVNLANNSTNVQKSIREFYFAQRAINLDSLEDFIAYQGDTLVLISVIRGARERAATSKAEVRLLEFAHRGTQNSEWIYSTVPLNGARHGIVLNYLLDFDLKEDDKPVMTSLIKRFVSFALTGSPNPGSVTTSPVWAPITSSDNIQYLLYAGGDMVQARSIFTEESKSNPHVQRMILWNDIYFKYYVAPQPVSSGARVLSVMLAVFISQMILSLF